MPAPTVTQSDNTQLSAKKASMNVHAVSQIQDKKPNRYRGNTTHMSKSHQNSATPQLTCVQCGKEYKHYASLYKHKKSAHPEVALCGSINCGESGCTFACRYIFKLREHLSLQHGIKMQDETLHFKTYEGKSVFMNY